MRCSRPQVRGALGGKGRRQGAGQATAVPQGPRQRVQPHASAYRFLLQRLQRRRLIGIDGSGQEVQQQIEL